MKLIEDIVQDSVLTLDEGVATLTLNRDDVRNALTGTALIEDIVGTAAWANRTDAVSVLIITGAGSAFSAGGNIKEMATRSGDFAGDVPEVEARYRRGIQQIPLAMDRINIPTIAAVNGPAIGAGFDLSCMCDFRIASTKAVFGETFVNLGIIPGDGGAWFLQRVLDYQKAMELALTGRLVAAEEAKDIGLLLDLVEAENLLTRAEELARQIASKPPQASRYTKRLYKSAQRMELADFLDFCALVQGVCHNTNDHLVAVNNFLTKAEIKYEGH
jgi:enoyl-CoA hydratase/carnithine racemase